MGDVSKEQSILSALVEILEDMIADWDMDLDDPLGANTRLIIDLGFESIDVVQFIAAIEEYENLTLNSAWKNNVAGAIAVFAQIATKIYHNIEIPPGFRKEEYFNIINNRLNQ